MWRKPLSAPPREGGNEREREATVERREASVPRRGTQGASQAPGVPRYVHAHGCSAEHPNDSRRSATPRSGSVKQGCKTRAQKCAAGTRRAVYMESSAVRAARPHPQERACRKSSANLNARARVAKDEERAIGFALMLRDASQRIWAVEAPALLSMRAGATHQPAAVQNERRLRFIVCGLLFTMTFATRSRPH